LYYIASLHSFIRQLATVSNRLMKKIKDTTVLLLCC
jgi:hypothetical protein